ncbi:MAG: phosphoesterase, partial [Acidobacteriaceae bacterium]|nr:phosphoesterase [Acidobacteriaceae bacterium]
MLAVLQVFAGLPVPASAQSTNPEIYATKTPIKHVIVIIGENRTFDHIFATYKPKAGEHVSNLLSKGIIEEDGTPGPNFSWATQHNAEDDFSDPYQISPQEKSAYAHLPAPLAGGPTDVCKNNGVCTLQQAEDSENGLAPGYSQFLLTGGTGLTGRTPDTRIEGVQAAAPYSTLQPGPFQLTNSKSFPYDSYAASPVHRFYQMWQQLDCNQDYATKHNPAGCNKDLFPYVETTIGAGSNGLARPATFSKDYSPAPAVTTGEGGTSMGFYNVQQGDAPYLKSLADNYAMSDNFHQSVMGGTGANHIMLGFGDAIWFSDANGNPATPPHNATVFGGTPSA